MGAEEPGSSGWSCGIVLLPHTGEALDIWVTLVLVEVHFSLLPHSGTRVGTPLHTYYGSLGVWAPPFLWAGAGAGAGAGWSPEAAPWADRAHNVIHLPTRTFQPLVEPDRIANGILIPVMDRMFVSSQSFDVETHMMVLGGGASGK